MNPTISGVIGPGLLNQVPTLPRVLFFKPLAHSACSPSQGLRAEGKGLGIKGFTLLRFRALELHRFWCSRSLGFVWHSEFRVRLLG